MRDNASPLPSPLDSGTACRREIIKAQKIPSNTIAGLETIAHQSDNPVAFLLAEGVSVADIARRLGRRYHVVWSESRRLMQTATRSVLREGEQSHHGLGIDVLELFAEVQSVVPEHLRR